MGKEGEVVRGNNGCLKIMFRIFFPFFFDIEHCFGYDTCQSTRIYSPWHHRLDKRSEKIVPPTVVLWKTGRG